MYLVYLLTFGCFFMANVYRVNIPALADAVFDPPPFSEDNIYLQVLWINSRGSGIFIAFVS